MLIEQDSFLLLALMRGNDLGRLPEIVLKKEVSKQSYLFLVLAGRYLIFSKVMQNPEEMSEC